MEEKEFVTRCEKRMTTSSFYCHFDNTFHRILARAVRHRADIEERVEDAALASYKSSSMSRSESEHDRTRV